MKKNKSKSLGNFRSIKKAKSTQVLEMKYQEECLIDNLKNKIATLYHGQKKQKIVENIDYDVFMAIAEDIGYYATGKQTGKNERSKCIGNELNRFILKLNKSQKNEIKCFFN